jgi:hypothetical protein
MTRFAILLHSAALCWVLPTISPAQTPPLGSKQGQVKKTDTALLSKKIFEDDRVRILIPPGWKVLKVGSPDDPRAAHPPAVPQTFIPSPGHGLLLSSKGYTLTLAYATGHASPIIGGRFPEVFTIPWPSDSWACGDGFQKIERRTGHEMRFVSLILDNPNAQIREFCGLPENAVFTHRWFAGYFTTADEGWFFPSEGDDCPEKAYTLTSNAKIPAELPHAGDPLLKQTIDEAIGIVASIRYKRCPPLSDHKK